MKIADIYIFFFNNPINFQLSVSNFQFKLSEGVECGRLTQQAKTARRRVLFALTVQISA